MDNADTRCIAFYSLNRSGYMDTYHGQSISTKDIIRHGARLVLIVDNNLSQITMSQEKDKQTHESQHIYKSVLVDLGKEQEEASLFWVLECCWSLSWAYATKCS